MMYASVGKTGRLRHMGHWNVIIVIRLLQGIAVSPAYHFAITIMLRHKLTSIIEGHVS